MPKPPPSRPTWSRRAALGLLGGAAAVAAAGATLWPRRRLADAEAMAAAYAAPLPPPDGPLRVFHLGHSLVGRDMPAMLAQLAGAGHAYDSQLGWGTSLREHWEPDAPINGFDTENAHGRFRPAREALATGDYDAVVLTEMVELRDAIRYHDSAAYFRRWSAAVRAANPGARIYLYETWHPLDDPGGFLTRIDRDLPDLWEGRILAADVAAHPDAPAHVIPAGQVMAAVLRAVDAAPRPGLARPEDLFARAPDGQQDTIHLNDIGAYLVAATHYATLYHRSPVGLPRALRRADGTPADAPGAAAAALIQKTAWEVVTRYPKTGVAR